MNRFVLSLLAPPVAVCRYGCAGCCAAPIGVFWITSIVSLVYGFWGGPLHADGVSWYTIGLGLLLWLIASTWAYVTLRNVNDDRCHKASSPLCRTIAPGKDEENPMEYVRKVR